MKKTVAISTVLLILCMALAFTGCNKKTNSGETASAVETANAGETKTCEYNFALTGFGFNLPENVKLANGFLILQDREIGYNKGVTYGYPVYMDMTKEERAALTAEEESKAHSAALFSVMCIKDVSTEAEAKEKALSVLEEAYGPADEAAKADLEAYHMAHQANGYTWLMKKYEKADDVNENCRAEYDALYDSLDTIMSSLQFFEPEVKSGGEEGTEISFDTVDLDGNPVNSKDLFAQNKVTMINIWGTTCGPCIKEMPELEEMNKEFQAKGGVIIGMVDDVTKDNQKNLEAAKEIISENGVTFLNICSWDGYTDLLPADGTPTTYFVDSNGKLIGTPVSGAVPSKYRENMEALLSTAE